MDRLAFTPNDFQTPIVDPKTGMLSPFWQTKLAHLFQTLGWKSTTESNVLDLMDELPASLPSGLMSESFLIDSPTVDHNRELVSVHSELMSAPQKTDDSLYLIRELLNIDRTWSNVRILFDTAANIANYPAGQYYPEAIYIETDTNKIYRVGTGAWTQIDAPALVRFLGTSNAFPALKRSGTILQVRLADDSAYSDLEVLDEAYDATNWNGSVEVPTKNAVRDKFEQIAPGATDALVNDDGFAGGWNGDAGHAPSKNAVYDIIATLLTSSPYTALNVTTDRAYDANATTVDELADVVGTIIADLQGKGILS